MPALSGDRRTYTFTVRKGFRFAPPSNAAVDAQTFRYSIERALSPQLGPLAPGMLVDHMCHNPACVNPLHLRVADKKQNAENMLGATRASKSGIRGVWQIPATGQWTAQYTHAGSKRTVGRFDTASAAEAAVIAARIAHYTHNDVDRIGSRSEADLVSLRA
jgi:ABC-type transport system substrate-binding protein